MKIAFVAIFVSLFVSLVNGQERVTTLGIQFKPMIPSAFFGTSSSSFSNNEYSVNFKPKLGYNFGMVVRQGVTKRLSVETGINIVQRQFRLDFIHPSLPSPEILEFRLMGYEIPIQALVYVRLGKHLWMNASGGFSLDMYPSDVQSQTGKFVDTVAFDFSETTLRKRWLQFSLLANYGFEWRTKKSGYFYIGASFHRPFSDIAYTSAQISIDGNPSVINYPLNGSYLTVDFRFFFHEEPTKQIKKNKKIPK